MKKAPLMLFALVAVFGLSACEGNPFGFIDDTVPGYKDSSTDDDGEDEDEYDVPVTGVTIKDDAREIYIPVNSYFTFGSSCVEITPSDATNKEYTLSSAREDVLGVSDYVVYGLKEGASKLTVTTVDGYFVDWCTIHVYVAE
ncbi:MAG: hypothetical protein LUC31_00910 [Coprobacillus sp.]|nr:hypothetical protein [Coprobacillus sp.]